MFANAYYACNQQLQVLTPDQRQFSSVQFSNNILSTQVL